MESLKVMLRKYSFEILENAEKYLCRICWKLPRDASRVPCGCLYCRECIENHLKGGNEYCATDNSNCKSTKLSFHDIYPNDDILPEVSELFAKCPSRRCEHETKLGMMWSHLKVCDPKNTNCPYYDMGCVKNVKEDQEISEHLVEENLYHTHLIVELIKNIQNENKTLKTQINKKQDEEECKQNYFELTKKLKRLKEEIDTLREKAESQNNKILSMEKKILSLNLELSLKEELIVNQNIQKQTSRCVSDKSVMTDPTESASEDVQSFIWVIGSLPEPPNKKDNLLSEPFYSSSSGYLFRLSVYPNMYPGYVTIVIRNYGGKHDKNLKWPFLGYITLTISDKNKKDKISMNKICKIEKNDRSEPFRFPNNQLSAAGILLNSNMCVECSIKT